MEIDWRRLLVGQLEFYWDTHLWPRLQGLTDDEYFWEPADGRWSLRRGEDGRYVLDEIGVLRDLYRAQATALRESGQHPTSQRDPVGPPSPLIASANVE